MKSATIVPVLLIAVAGLFSSSIAEASCQNICVRALRACEASGWPVEDCWAEHAACLDACAGGGGFSGERALKDEGPAQSCVTEHGESAGRRALLALMPEPGDRAEVRASRAR